MRDLPPAVRSVLHDHPTGLLETIVAVVSDLSRPARLMLEVVALADHDSLDVALLRRVMGVAENELWTSFDELRAYSLVSTREEGDQSFVKLDTPVREAVRAQIAPGRVVQVAQSALASGAILGADADEDNVLDLVGARARILTRWALAALKVVLEASGDQLMPDVTRFLLLQRVVILADDLIQNGHHALATVLVSRWREVVAIPFSTLEQSFTDELCSYSARLDLELCRHSADGDARREKLLAAAQTWHRLMASYPTHETYAHQMVRCQERLAQLAVRMGDPAAAGQHLAEAELAMEVYAPSETRPEHLHDHHTTHARLDWLAHQSSWARLRMLLVARSCPENSSEIFDDIAVSFFRQPERDYQAIRDVLDEAIASATGWQAKILLYYRRGSLLLLPAMESANDKAITSALGDFDVVIATATQALQTEQSPRTCARLGDHLMGVTEGVRHLLSIYPGVEEQLVYTAVLAAACSRRAHEANPLDELATNTLINALELLRATRPDNKGIRVARPPSAEWAPLRCPVCGIAPDENCMRICDDGHAWSLLHLSPRCVKCSGRAVDVGCSACRFRRPIWQWRSVDSSCEVTLLRG